MDKMSQGQDRERGQRKGEGLETNQDHSHIIFIELTMFVFEVFPPSLF